MGVGDQMLIFFPCFFAACSCLSSGGHSQINEMNQVAVCQITVAATTEPQTISRNEQFFPKNDLKLKTSCSSFNVSPSEFGYMEKFMTNLHEVKQKFAAV